MAHTADGAMSRPLAAVAMRGNRLIWTAAGGPSGARTCSTADRGRAKPPVAIANRPTCSGHRHSPTAVKVRIYRFAAMSGYVFTHAQAADRTFSGISTHDLKSEKSAVRQQVNP